MVFLRSLKNNLSVPSIFLLDAPVRTEQTVLKEEVRRQGASTAKSSQPPGHVVDDTGSAAAAHFENCTRLLQAHVCFKPLRARDHGVLIEKKSLRWVEKFPELLWSLAL